MKINDANFPTLEFTGYEYSQEQDELSHILNSTQLS